MTSPQQDGGLSDFLSSALEVNRDVDKSSWPSGRWGDEPDRVHWSHGGLDCLIVRQRTLGHLCGYVGVPPDHPWYEQHYDNVRRIRTDEDDPYGDWVDVHGGLTFSGSCREGGAICHRPEFAANDPVWWLGFDCAHLGDMSPGNRFDGYDETYKSVLYVRRQTESLADQALAVVRAKGSA